jgi:hypothetical protein
MPKESLADTREEWDSLYSALGENEALNDPYLRNLREQLGAVILALGILAADQKDLQARRQAVTQQMRITRKKGADLVVQIRSAIRSRIGHRSEMLTRYRIRPTRRRTRRVEEEAGISVYPRPDLLAAIGLAPDSSPATPDPEPDVPEPGDAVPAGGPPSSEES